LPTPKKKEDVKEITEQLKNSKIAVLAEYRGLTVSELTQVRRRLREQGVDFSVVKNTLARIAAKDAGKDELLQILGGPVAIAYGREDVVAPAKVLTDYVRSTRTALKIKGALLDHQVLSSAEVAELASLPSRDVLAAQLLGTLQAPISGLLGVLDAHIGGLLNILQARFDQLGEGPQPAPVPA